MSDDRQLVRAIHELPEFTVGAYSDFTDGRWVTVHYEGMPYPIALQLRTAADGRLVCSGLRLASDDVPGGSPPDTPEVTARSLRKIPLTRLVVAIAGVLAQQTWDAAEDKVIPSGRAPARPGPKGHPDDHYRSIAKAYRKALVEHPRGTFAALAAEQHKSEATVRRWVQRAQDKGYLGASTPGKAGRQPTREEEL